MPRSLHGSLSAGYMGDFLIGDGHFEFTYIDEVKRYPVENDMIVVEGYVDSVEEDGSFILNDQYGKIRVSAKGITENSHFFAVMDEPISVYGSVRMDDLDVVIDAYVIKTYDGEVIALKNTSTATDIGD